MFRKFLASDQIYCSSFARIFYHLIPRRISRSGRLTVEMSLPRLRAMHRNKRRNVWTWPLIHLRAYSFLPAYWMSVLRGFYAASPSRVLTGHVASPVDAHPRQTVIFIPRASVGDNPTSQVMDYIIKVVASLIFAVRQDRLCKNYPLISLSTSYTP